MKDPATCSFTFRTFLLNVDSYGTSVVRWVPDVVAWCLAHWSDECSTCHVVKGRVACAAGSRSWWKCDRGLSVFCLLVWFTLWVLWQCPCHTSIDVGVNLIDVLRSPEPQFTVFRSFLPGHLWIHQWFGSDLHGLLIVQRSCSMAFKLQVL